MHSGHIVVKSLDFFSRNVWNLPADILPEWENLFYTLYVSNLATNKSQRGLNQENVGGHRPRLTTRPSKNSRTTSIVPLAIGNGTSAMTHRGLFASGNALLSCAVAVKHASSVTHSWTACLFSASLCFNVSLMKMAQEFSVPISRTNSSKQTKYTLHDQ